MSSMDAKEIFTIRAKLGLTQDEMARRLKCTARTISRLEHQKSKPTKAMVRRLERLANKRREA